MTIAIDLIADLGEGFGSYGVAYANDGTLAKCSEPGAILHDNDDILVRTVRMVTEGIVTSAHGVDVKVDIDSILLHGDNADSLERGPRADEALENAGMAFTPFPQFLPKHTEVPA